MAMVFVVVCYSCVTLSLSTLCLAKATLPTTHCPNSPSDVRSFLVCRITPHFRLWAIPMSVILVVERMWCCYCCYYCCCCCYCCCSVVFVCARFFCCFLRLLVLFSFLKVTLLLFFLCCVSFVRLHSFLGTAGQTIDNIERYVVVDDKLNILEQTLKWRHIAPTAPDQLGCYPFTELDPFVIGKCPHVYFIGNQKKFQTKLITGNEREKETEGRWRREEERGNRKGEERERENKSIKKEFVVSGDDGQQVRLICVPSFADTPTIVLVNLNTLNVHPITFSTSL